MSRTSIEWATHVWNPVRGCSRVSPGCEHCYAERVAALRLSYPAYPLNGAKPGRKAGPYRGLAEVTSKGPRWTGVVRLVPEVLDDARHWSPRHPRRVFVNSMSDLFHEKLSDEEIRRVFDAMMEAPAHTFLVLTKRSRRMRDFMLRGESNILAAPKTALIAAGQVVPWPPVNVWLGVSVEDPGRTVRVADLLVTPAAHRFVSAEPLLGPVDFTRIPAGEGRFFDALRSEFNDLPGEKSWSLLARALDGIIVGGESGPAARPCDLAWVRSIVAQCRETKTPVFVKQIGSRPVERDIVGGPGDSTAFTDRMLPYRVPREQVAAQGRVAVECGHGVDVCPRCDAGTAPVRDPKGGDPAEWPEDLRVRELPW